MRIREPRYNEQMSDTAKETFRLALKTLNRLGKVMSDMADSDSPRIAGATPSLAWHFSDVASIVVGMAKDRTTHHTPESIASANETLERVARRIGDA